YSLKYFINGESVEDIRSYEIIENDKILITFGGETDDQIQDYLKQLDNQEIMK
ncbi:MAG: protein-disulfide isomerase, partial [Flavobacteriales bacterium]|nr:protein-disulfide isomerase [Flavobacteriales bacterium]